MVTVSPELNQSLPRFIGFIRSILSKEKVCDYYQFVLACAEDNLLNRVVDIRVYDTIDELVQEFLRREDTSLTTRE